MASGLSLHLGLNAIDPGHDGSDGKLAGCENDAHAMQRIARDYGDDTHTLFTSKATSRGAMRNGGCFGGLGGFGRGSAPAQRRRGRRSQRHMEILIPFMDVDAHWRALCCP